MLKRTDDAVVAGDKARADAPPAANVAAQVLMGGGKRAIIVVEDEARGETIARLAEAFAPAVTVIHLVASDALPGDAARPAPRTSGNGSRRCGACVKRRRRGWRIPCCWCCPPRPARCATRCRMPLTRCFPCSGSATASICRRCPKSRNGSAISSMTASTSRARSRSAAA